MPIRSQYYQDRWVPDLQQMLAESPQDLQAVTVTGGSAAGNARGDQAGADAELQALNQLRTLYAGEPQRAGRLMGGKVNAAAAPTQPTSLINSQDRARINQRQAQQDVASRGAAGALQQSLGMRTTGAGANGVLAAAIGGQQRGEDQAMQESEFAGLAQSRALQAMASAGQMGTERRSRSFDQATRKGQAADIINRFNTNAANTIGRGNVGATNAVQQFNVGRPEDRWQMQAQLTGAQSDENMGYAQASADRLAKAQERTGQVVGGAAQIAGGLPSWFKPR